MLKQQDNETIETSVWDGNKGGIDDVYNSDDDLVIRQGKSNIPTVKHVRIVLSTESVYTSDDNEPISTKIIQGFENCINLTSVEIVIPPSRRQRQGQERQSYHIHIGPFAFSGCKSLERIDISISPNNDDDDDDKNSNNYNFFIGKYAFQGCRSLKCIRFPGTVQQIQQYAFAGCHSLEDINLFPPNNEAKNVNTAIRTIAEGTFHNCISLKEIHLPKSVTTIKKYAFSGCISLKELNIPSHSALTTIMKNAFQDCTSLEAIIIPDTIRHLGCTVFQNCTSLKSVTFLSSKKNHNDTNNTTTTFTTIRNGTFFDCHALDDIVLPDTVQTIGEAAFRNCHTLQTMRLPASLQKIGSSAFKGCSALQAMEIPNGYEILHKFSSADNTIVKDNSSLQVPIDDVQSIQFFCDVNRGGSSNFLQHRISNKSYPSGLWSDIISRVVNGKMPLSKNSIRCSSNNSNNNDKDKNDNYCCTNKNIRRASIIYSLLVRGAAADMSCLWHEKREV